MVKVVGFDHAQLQRHLVSERPGCREPTRQRPHDLHIAGAAASGGERSSDPVRNGTHSQYHCGS